MLAFSRPGLLRILWTTPLASGLAVALTVALRSWIGMQPVHAEQVLLTNAWIAGAVGALVGIGAFDAWWHWMIGAPTRPDDHSQHGATGWRDYFRFNTDHKVIGVQYVVTTFVFFLVGGACAMAFRAELAHPGTQMMTGDQYNGLLSQHATLMVFTFLVPVFAGVGNYVIPLMLGAPDMAFPRLNALSFWLLPIGGITLISAFAFGNYRVGWTSYPTLADIVYSPQFGQSLYSLGVQLAGASSIATAVNFLATIITMRAPGMTLFRMPLLVWANLATSALVVAATPFIAGAQFLALFDRVMGTHFFDAPEGDTLVYQHIFWFYSHPAVYIMVLPGFGIISEVIATNSRKPIFGYRTIAFSTVAIAVLGFSVWAHHMFVAGLETWLRVPMMLSSMLIAVPTGIKIFSWLGTMWRGVLQMNTAMLFACGFLWTFVIGGLTGVMVASVPFDIHVANTYFIVAHLHYVLFGGSVMTLFAGLYYWYPKVTGRLIDEGRGRLHFWLTFVSLNCTFFPMHLLGLEGMPRRVQDYAPRFESWNLFISLASFVLGASTIVFVANAVRSARHGQPAGANPWRSLTLEWALSSPPPMFNFPAQPRVVGGPYRYGEAGGRHAVLPAPLPAEVGAERAPAD